MTQHYTSGDYAITGVQNAFNNKISYWISKKDCTDAYYCFSLENNSMLNTNLQKQLDDFASYIALFEAKHASQTKRDFDVETPLGTLRVWAKHEKDCPADYPGVYIDIRGGGRGGDDGLLACVEYDAGNKLMQTCVYQPDLDTPVETIIHNLPDKEDEDDEN